MRPSEVIGVEALIRWQHPGHGAGPSLDACQHTWLKLTRVLYGK
jgi:hypothetical protein